MDEPRYKVGDWVKEKNGTQGMTVISYVRDENSSFTGEVRCQYKNAVGETVESTFWDDDLVKL
jgi:uncharacterized protein YodC (DUF2158 family)